MSDTFNSTPFNKDELREMFRSTLAVLLAAPHISFRREASAIDEESRDRRNKDVILKAQKIVNDIF